VKPSKLSNVNQSMKKTLQEMTAADLVLKFHKAESVVQTFNFEEPNWMDVWRKSYENLQTELDARCQSIEIDYGINYVGIETGFTPRSWVDAPTESENLERLKEIHALLGYMIHKSK